MTTVAIPSGKTNQQKHTGKSLSINSNNRPYVNEEHVLKPDFALASSIQKQCTVHCVILTPSAC